MKDLYQWTFNPIGLLERGASQARVFPLHLWRKTIVGYRPEWNRAVLSDLETFRSRGSLSALTPYLHGGVVHLDQPAHDPRRRECTLASITSLTYRGDELESLAYSEPAAALLPLARSGAGA